MDRGALTLGTPVYETIGAKADDPRKRAITLQHLVTMSTGLACDDNSEDSPGGEDHVQNTEQDWVATGRASVVATQSSSVFCT